MNTEESIFAEAIKLPISQRGEFLREECGEDTDLKVRLKQLLAAHEDRNGILDTAETLVTDSEMPKIASGRDIGPYRLLQKLGEGGFGVVFMAEQRRPIQRRVALKVIKPGMNSSDVVTRFEAERQALAMMDHPNIAQIFDGGEIEVDHRPYFVMELVQGVTITQYCDANSLTTNERLRLFMTVCNAVQHAHQKGIIHRDIKPSNVMVTLHDGKPVVKVIDFGVAKALHQRLVDKTMFTQYGAMVGTPQYMSPEQAEMTGLDIDTRSDVYSLAVLLYELMTGTTPLQRESLRTASYQELQRLIREDEPEKPSQRLSSTGDKLTVIASHRSASPDRLAKEIQGDLDWIIMKGLEKDRRRRYESASALAADVQRALDQKPVLAGPPSFGYRAQKFVLRHRGRVLLAGGIATLILAIAIGLLNHRRHLLAAREKEASQLASAVDEASAGLVAAVEGANSPELWTTADLLVDQVEELVLQSEQDSPERESATNFLSRFRRAREDRDFTRSVEELLIARSTDQSPEGLQYMEEQLREILKNRGYDLNELSQSELSRQIAEDRSPVKVTDAMELWLATRIKLAAAGGESISTDEVRQWTQSMCEADPHPMRCAIREVIYRTVPLDKQYLDDAVDKGNIATTCARKLSWLAEAFEAVGDEERSRQIRTFALMQHPNDLMLNFDYATLKGNQGKWEQAVRYYMRCTAIRPDVPGTWKKLANALSECNELKQACEAIKMAIRLDEIDATSHLRLSQWLLENGQPADALAAAEKALSLNSELGDAWIMVGRAHMSHDRFAQAIVAFERFQELADDSTNATVNDWLVDCRQKIASRLDK